MSKAPHSSKQDQDVAKLKQDLANITEALQRERADSTNMRRRHDEQVAILKEIVKSDVVKQLLPVIDNFERSLKHVPKDLASNDYVTGIKGIINQFEAALVSLGVERIATVGGLFDPRYHEAISMEEGDGSYEIISEELQPGYKLGDHVIRHAMVKVKMGEPEPPKSSN